MSTGIPLTTAGGTLQGLVRTPGPRLAVDCELTHLAPSAIDFDRALIQHERYVEILRECGVDVRVLPALDGYPDSTFVEDAAVILDEVSVVTRPGAESRRAEAQLLADSLPSDRGRLEIAAPGTLDGGDVLIVDRTVLVGRSSRSNDSGVEALCAGLEPFGYTVQVVDVKAALHLKTVLTAPGPGLLLAAPGLVDLASVRHALPEHEVLEADEAAGANVLRLRSAPREVVLVSSSAPGTARKLEAAGLNVRTVEITEFEKAEAGLTCLSLIWKRPV